MASAMRSVRNTQALPGVSLMKLRDGMCKFPLGGLSDTVTRFCGEPAATGVSYCEKCRERAFTNIKRSK